MSFSTVLTIAGAMTVTGIFMGFIEAIDSPAPIKIAIRNWIAKVVRFW